MLHFAAVVFDRKAERSRIARVRLMASTRLRFASGFDG